MRKVFIPPYSYDSTVAKLFKQQNWHIATHIVEADLLCLTGGEDINPALYSHPVHRSTWFNDTRDHYEVKVFREAEALKMPMFGICRGAQLINALNGGKMYQDVTNHTKAHMSVIDGEEMLVSSLHHQMMIPTSNAIILGWGIETNAECTGFDEEAGDFKTHQPQDGHLDIEALRYGNQLCVQGHPEYALYRPDYERFAAKCFEMIDAYCFAEA